MAVRLNFVYSPRQPHRPRHLASKAHRVFFSSTLLRRRCRNLRQANGAATIPCSVSRRFTTRQLMLSLLSPEKAKGPGSSPALPRPSRDHYAAAIHQQRAAPLGQAPLSIGLYLPLEGTVPTTCIIPVT